MNSWFFTIVAVKDNDVFVSNPYKSNTSMAVLCDKARNMSLENENVFVSIYKQYFESPTFTRLLYRFLNGRLVKL